RWRRWARCWKAIDELARWHVGTLHVGRLAGWQVGTLHVDTLAGFNVPTCQPANVQRANV
ncbi:MAG: hypothetical protein NZT92_14485, partial [Abditibacteriales bacterium]|nr:hypothetical protein [Abditibacteriales bacterium]